MHVGDILEWLAGAALATACYLWAGLPLMLVAIGVVLAYEAQCYDQHVLRFRRGRKQ